MIISDADSKKRLDVLVSEKLGFSRSAVQKLTSASLIVVNGKPSKSNYKLKVGDVLELREDQAHQKVTEIPILFQDESIIVIDKPAGVTVHPAPGEKDLTVSELLPQPIYVVHRLDKGTSGVMVFARTEKAAEFLKKQFHDRTVKKVYRALVSGDITDDSGSIDISLGRSMTARGKIIPVEDGRGAVTDFTVIKRYSEYTLLSAMPRTGRTHQIRTHFAAIGHPLYSDIRYGGNEGERIFLHAYSLKFTNPASGKVQEFISPLPEKLKEILEHVAD